MFCHNVYVPGAKDQAQGAAGPGPEGPTAPWDWGLGPGSISIMAGNTRKNMGQLREIEIPNNSRT